MEGAGFSDGARNRLNTIDAGDWVGLNELLGRAKEKFKFAEDCRIVSCYEAGRDGFWIHRALVEQGIENLVVDSASIEVNRRQRRVKTDRVDVKGLLRLLQRYAGGERGMLSVVRVPSVEEEDDRRLHRERERLVKERGAHRARIQSLLVAHGIRLPIDSALVERLETMTGGMGYALGVDLKAEIAREYERYRLVDEQIRGLEKARREQAKAGSSAAMKQGQIS
jgi:transposase